MPVQFEDLEAVKRIMSQLPTDIDVADVKKTLNECNGDELETICKLLDVATKTETNQNKNQKQQMWDNIREICDTYDRAVNAAMRKST